eukprot:ANDGO_06946.mRNA.1 hypothetical protein
MGADSSKESALVKKIGKLPKDHSGWPEIIREFLLIPRTPHVPLDTKKIEDKFIRIIEEILKTILEKDVKLQIELLTALEWIMTNHPTYNKLLKKRPSLEPYLRILSSGNVEVVELGLLIVDRFVNCFFSPHPIPLPLTADQKVHASSEKIAGPWNEKYKSDIEMDIRHEFIQDDAVFALLAEGLKKALLKLDPSAKQCRYLALRILDALCVSSNVQYDMQLKVIDGTILANNGAMFEKILDLVRHSDYRIRLLACSIIYKVMSEQTPEHFTKLQAVALRHATVLWVFQFIIQEESHDMPWVPVERVWCTRLLHVLVDEFEPAVVVIRKLLDDNDYMLNWASTQDGSILADNGATLDGHATLGLWTVQSVVKLSKNDRKVAETRVKVRSMKRYNFSQLFEKLVTVPPSLLSTSPAGVFESARIRWSKAALAELRTSVTKHIKDYASRIPQPFLPTELVQTFETLKSDHWTGRIYGFYVDFLVRPEVKINIVIASSREASHLMFALIHELLVHPGSIHAPIYFQAILLILKMWNFVQLVVESPLSVSTYEKEESSRAFWDVIGHFLRHYARKDDVKLVSLIISIIKHVILQLPDSSPSLMCFVHHSGASLLISTLEWSISSDCPALANDPWPVWLDVLSILQHFTSLTHFSSWVIAPRFQDKFWRILRARASPVEVHVNVILFLSSALNTAAATPAHALRDATAAMLLANLLGMLLPVCFTEASANIMQKYLRKSITCFFPASCVEFLDKNGSKKFASLIENGISDPTVMFDLSMKSRLVEFSDSVWESFCDENRELQEIHAKEDVESFAYLDSLFFEGHEKSDCAAVNAKIIGRWNGAWHDLQAHPCGYPENEEVLRIEGVFIKPFLALPPGHPFRISDIKKFMKVTFAFLQELVDRNEWTERDLENESLLNRTQLSVFNSRFYEDSLEQPYSNFDALIHRLQGGDAAALLLAILNAGDDARGSNKRVVATTPSIFAAFSKFFFEISADSALVPLLLQFTAEVLEFGIQHVLKIQPVVWLSGKFDTDPFFIRVCSFIDAQPALVLRIFAAATGVFEAVDMMRRTGIGLKLLRLALLGRSSSAAASVDSLIKHLEHHRDPADWHGKEKCRDWLAWVRNMVPFGCVGCIDVPVERLPVETVRCFWTFQMQQECAAYVEKALLDFHDPENGYLISKSDSAEEVETDAATTPDKVLEETDIKIGYIELHQFDIVDGVFLQIFAKRGLVSELQMSDAELKVFVSSCFSFFVREGTLRAFVAVLRTLDLLVPVVPSAFCVTSLKAAPFLDHVNVFLQNNNYFADALMESASKAGESTEALDMWAKFLSNCLTFSVTIPVDMCAFVLVMLDSVLMVLSSALLSHIHADSAELSRLLNCKWFERLWSYVMLVTTLPSGFSLFSSQMTTRQDWRIALTSVLALSSLLFLRSSHVSVLEKKYTATLAACRASRSFVAEALLVLLCGPLLDKDIADVFVVSNVPAAAGAAPSIANTEISEGKAQIFADRLWGDHETPYLIWNKHTRQYLSKFMEDHLTTVISVFGSKASMIDPCSMRTLLGLDKYEQPSLAGELFLSGIYIRVFLQSRFVSMRNPELLISALVTYVRRVEYGKVVLDVSSSSESSHLLTAWFALFTAIRTFSFSDSSIEAEEKNKLKKPSAKDVHSSSSTATPTKGADVPVLSLFEGLSELVNEDFASMVSRIQEILASGKKDDWHTAGVLLLSLFTMISLLDTLMSKAPQSTTTYLIQSSSLGSLTDALFKLWTLSVSCSSSCESIAEWMSTKGEDLKNTIVRNRPAELNQRVNVEVCGEVLATKVIVQVISRDPSNASSFLLAEKNFQSLNTLLRLFASPWQSVFTGVASPDARSQASLGGIRMGATEALQLLALQSQSSVREWVVSRLGTKLGEQLERNPEALVSFADSECAGVLQRVRDALDGKQVEPETPATPQSDAFVSSDPSADAPTTPGSTTPPTTTTTTTTAMSPAESASESAEPTKIEKAE